MITPISFGEAGGIQVPIEGGQGRIRRIEGLESLLARFGPHVVAVELLPPGAPRRNWKASLLSDGWMVVRHPDLATALRMADAVGTDLQIFAE